MIVDGKAIAAEIYQGIRNRLTHLNTRPHLTVFTCEPNFETQKFLALKKRKAEEVGIDVNVVEFPVNITTEEVVQSLLHAAMQTDGIIVQLPFPDTVDIDEILKNIPPSLDIDAVHYDGTGREVLPPVVGAIKAIVDRQDILLASAKVAVIGEGKLVGKPAALWAQKMGSQVTIINRNTKNISEILQSSHIIISGAGQPGLIKPEDVSEGVIIFDAGTSEESGELRGDVLPECAKKAEVFTPVPGGIGPITVAILLRNLVKLLEAK